jgi:3'-phosphoadenosine 5'-phosphosulfate sulfotransferase (PAPS reductase)/FAD synthetase
MSIPLVIAYGGGLNSTAMLVGFRERGIVPDLLLFADTGAERPETYAHVKQMSEFTQLWWGLEIETVRSTYKGEPEGLDDECIRKSLLPSLAYGRKACSMKHKINPQQKRIR